MNDKTGSDYKRKAVAVPDDDANGTAIRAMRQASCMPQKELAEALGIHPSYLCDLEQGNRSMSEELFNKAREAITSYAKKPPTIITK